MLGAENNYNLKVNLTGNATQLNIALQSSTSKLQQFAARAKSIGSSLSRSLTLPLALVGGASIKMALDFDKSMTKIKTLVGVASNEVDAMGGAVKRLAVDTGVNANDAADALFFITSAGLRGADAMKVLEAATKASAIGLGEVKTVADAVTSAVNAYGQENLSAESATDILTAAVREGKLEADSLAQSMGKVLPVSSQLGVGFEEVGAALAAMSRTGTDAAMATTSLRGILSALLNPSSQANEELENFGLSAQGLREQLKEQGLLSVLKTLTDRFGDNQEAAGKVFGNVRALTGVLDLMGNNVGTTEQIFASMTDTTGTLNTAFTELEDELSFKFKKSLEAVKTSFTELGKTLAIAILPAFQKITGSLTILINKFNNLDKSTQNIVLTLGGIAIVLGPALIIIGSLASAIAALINPISIAIAGIAGIGFAIDNLIMPLDAFLLKAIAIFNKINEYARQTGKLILNALSFGVGDSVDTILTETKLAIMDINSRLENDLAQLDGTSITERIQLMFNQLKDKFKQIGVGIGGAISDGIEEGITKTRGIDTSMFGDNGEITSDTSGLDELLAQGTKKTREELNKLAEATTQASSVATSALQAMFNTLSGQLAKVFAGGTVSFEQFSQQVFSIIGDLLIQLGMMAIASAKIFESFGNPFTSIAAGLAAIALGAAIKGMVNKVRGGEIMEFASGGIISGPTLGLMGEYAGARHNPEVVAPLDKLKSMIGSNGSQNLSGEFVVRGQDLVVALQRAERNRNRFK